MQLLFRDRDQNQTERHKKNLIDRKAKPARNRGFSFYLTISTAVTLPSRFPPDNVRKEITKMVQPLSEMKGNQNVHLGITK